MAAEMINPDATQIRAAGGLLLRPGKATDVLLIYRNGVWDLPKGKLEEGESIPECAAREVSEEIGLLVKPGILADLGTTRHTYTLDGQTLEKETFWFLMQLNEKVKEFSPQKIEGITDVQWVAAVDAIRKVGFENLQEVIARFTENRENLQQIELNYSD